MIGKIYTVLMSYYDNRTNTMKIKGRPALIIAKADNDDYVVLPVSSITHKENINPIYDVEINPSIYPDANLTRISYVRTHKQHVVHRGELGKEICDLKVKYTRLYTQIIQLREKFSEDITRQALL